MSESGNASPRSRWTFLTNHAHVLLCIARDPGIRLRDIARDVGITERAAQGIVADLVDAGYVSRTRVGRRNQYSVRPDRPLRHPLEDRRPIGDLLSLLTRDDAAAGSEAPRPRSRGGAPPAARARAPRRPATPGVARGD
jgi:predicted transcriptional regulator